MNYHQPKQYNTKKRPNWKSVLLSGLLHFFKFFITISLPFVVLVRSAIYLYQEWHWNTWLALGGALVVTTLVIWIYIEILQRMIGVKSERIWKAARNKMLVSFVLVNLYMLFAIFSFSGENAKGNEVKEEYAELHPFMKIAFRTWIMVDSDLLITDASRVPEDYQKMGLPTKNHSMHFVQNTGYVHAIDLRVKDRSIVMNWFVQGYFKLLGFNAVRHVGTDDHLHVSLSTDDQPLRW